MYRRSDRKSHRQIFVGLYVKDPRLILGIDYYKDPLYATPLAFDIVTEEELQAATKSVSTSIKDGMEPDHFSSFIPRVAHEFSDMPMYDFENFHIWFFFSSNLIDAHYIRIIIYVYTHIPIISCDLILLI